MPPPDPSVLPRSSGHNSPGIDPPGSRGRKMQTWLCHAGQKLEIFLPFLGKYRPPPGRCCQTCTPKSWDGFCPQHLSHCGFRDALRVTEEDTRYRGWLVRRVCVFLAIWNWKIPTETPRDLPARVCSSRRVQDAAARCSPGNGGSPQESPQGSPRCWEQKIQEILAEIQAPLCPLLLRLCSWALLKLLSRLFLGVQLHGGQLEMVLRAARRPGVPLVFLGRHSSHLDGLLLSLLLFSRGLGVPRVALGARTCSPPLRAFLRCLGGIFLPRELEQGAGNGNTELLGAVLAGYVQEVLRSQQPLLIFLEEPPAPRLLSAPAQHWLALVCRALRDGAVPDVLLVPLSVTYEVTPGGIRQEQNPPAPLTLRFWFGALGRILCPSWGSARVDFAQPFSLQEFLTKNLVGRRAEELLLLPPILGTCPTSLDTKIPNPDPSTAEEEEEEEEGVLVTRLGLHALSDAISCSAVMAVAITSALLLHRHPGGVLLSRLLQDFSWLLEELLLHQRDVGFSGRVGVLVWHSLQPLGPLLTCHHLGPLGDVLVVPKGSAEARRELGHHSAGILPVLAWEALGACAIRALVLQVLPFLGAPLGSPPSITLSQEELHSKGLELLGLLPPTLLGLQPCQPLPSRSQDMVDKLLLCGLLQVEEQDTERRGCDLSPRVWARVDFSDSDSEEEAPKCCYKLTEPPSCPGLLLFLCRLLAPTLRGIARAATFLGLAPWPLPESDYVEALIQFLQEEESGDLPSRTLALSSLQTFKEMGVLEEVQPPPCPLLHLSPQFQSSASREKLEAFIQQFIQD